MISPVQTAVFGLRNLHTWVVSMNLRISILCTDVKISGHDPEKLSYYLLHCSLISDSRESHVNLVALYIPLCVLSTDIMIPDDSCHSEGDSPRAMVIDDIPGNEDGVDYPQETLSASLVLLNDIEDLEDRLLSASLQSKVCY